MTINECPAIDLPPLDLLAEGLGVDERPSTYAGAPWIPAFSETSTDTADTGKCGKWLLFVPREEVDGVWAGVQYLTRTGWLGSESKVSTTFDNPNATNDDHVINLYVDNWRDVEDVRRVLVNLRAAGLGRSWLNFKRTVETKAKKYTNRGGKDIAVFTSPPDAEGGFYTKQVDGTATWLTGTNDAEVVAAIETLDRGSK